MNWTKEEMARARQVFAEVGGSCSITPVMDLAAELLAARGGTMTAEAVADYNSLTLVDKPWSNGSVQRLLRHITAQGAKVAALEAERDEWRAKAMDVDAHPVVVALRREKAELAAVVHDSDCSRHVLGGAVDESRCDCRLQECPDLKEEFTLVRQALAGSPVENVRPAFERVAALASRAAQWKFEAMDSVLKPAGQVAELAKVALSGVPDGPGGAAERAAVLHLAALARQGQEAEGVEERVRHPSLIPCVEGSCHHEDGGTPGHAERVAARSQAFNEAVALPDADRHAYDAGAEDMRVACALAVSQVFEREAVDPGLARLIADALDGAAP